MKVEVVCAFELDIHNVSLKKPNNIIRISRNISESKIVCLDLKIEYQMLGRRNVSDF